jgi:hypothetical protein
MTQKTWRRLGALDLLAAASMALYAVVSSVLHDSVLLIASFLSEEVNASQTDLSPAFLAVYWLVFSGTIVFALYLAVVDIRYIRLQYAAEKHEILKRTLNDRRFRESLRERTIPGNDGPSLN